MVLFYGMKDVFAPIDKAGRIVLPKSVREELAIHPGDLLKISIHGNEVTLKPNKETAGFVKRGKALVFSSEGADLLDNEMVESVRNATRGDLLSNVTKGLPSRQRQ